MILGMMGESVVLYRRKDECPVVFQRPLELKTALSIHFEDDVDET